METPKQQLRSELIAAGHESDVIDVIVDIAARTYQQGVDSIGAAYLRPLDPKTGQRHVEPNPYLPVAP